MDIATVAVGVNAFKTASEALQSLKGLVSSDAAAAKITAIQTALIDAQQSAIDTQRAHSAQVERVSTLEAEIRNYETWNTEKDRYILADMGDGFTANVLAYRLKDTEIGAEPAHAICPDCYQKRVKSILQQVTLAPGVCQVRVCQQCGWEA